MDKHHERQPNTGLATFPWVKALVFLILIVLPERSYAWGSCGHEQVNGAALKLIAKTPLGSCMNEMNSALVLRLAITPDREWKSKKGPFEMRRYERPLHFFEVDAFQKRPDIGILHGKLASSDYSEAFPEYQAILTRGKSVASHGTAPWRILQLYRSGVEALKKQNWEDAIFYLSTLGHYVADMSQVFHATTDFDGADYPNAKGIHSVFEEKQLEDRSCGHEDKETKLWDSFDGMESEVLKRARAELPGGKVLPLESSTLVPEVLKLVIQGYSYVDPLLRGFAAARVAHLSKASSRYVPKAVVRDFENRKISPSMTVFQAAEQRMADASALLARIWLGAYVEAGAPKTTSCRTYKFSEKAATEKYPAPEYLLKSGF